MQKEVKALQSKEKKLLKKRQTGQWQTEGPGNAGARINTIAVASENPDRIYLGYSGGGIYTSGEGVRPGHPVLMIIHFFPSGIWLRTPIDRVKSMQAPVTRISPAPHSPEMVFINQQTMENHGFS